MSKSNPSPREIFEGLGILDDTPPANPFDEIGISREMAGELYQNDKSGELVKLAVRGLYRSLTQIYHPDPGTADSERFQAIQEAYDQIGEATSASLQRWTRVTLPESQKTIELLKEEKGVRTERASGIIESLVEEADNPLFFSNFSKANGLVVRSDNLCLIQPIKKGLSRVTGTGSPTYYTSQARPLASGLWQTAAGVEAFFEADKKKGYNNQAVNMMFLNGSGEIYLYDKDQQTVARSDDTLAEMTKKKSGSGDIGRTMWMRETDPQVMYINRGVDGKISKVLSFEFPPKVSSRDRSKLKDANIAWETEYEVLGSTSNQKLFGVLGIKNTQGATRPLSSSGEATNIPMRLQAFSFEDLLGQDSQYTPLLTPGNSLILRDPLSHQLIVTDAEILAILPKQ